MDEQQRNNDYMTLLSLLEMITMRIADEVGGSVFRSDLQRYIEMHQRPVSEDCEARSELAALCLEALVVQREIDPDDLSVQSVADCLEQIVDLDERRAFHGRVISARLVGLILREEFGFETVRSGSHNGRYVVSWNEERARVGRQYCGIEDDRVEFLVDKICNRGI